MTANLDRRMEIVAAGSRFHTRLGWLESWHSFSFGRHQNPANTHHGLLLVNNDDIIAPGGGFGMHRHDNMEIVTWVLQGALEHQDSLGNHGTITPGQAQRMSAGTGIAHSEFNPSADQPAHLVQMWVVPDTRDIAPGYEQRDLAGAPVVNGLVAVASGRGHAGAVAIRQRDAVLWVARLAPGEKAVLPAAPYLHVFVARGAATLEGAGALAAGEQGAEALVWEMHAALAQ